MERIFSPSRNTVFLDMDGVVADFDRFVLEKMGRTFNHISGPAGDSEMWDFLQKVDHLYLQLEPTSYAFELWELVNKHAQNVEFLTAIPRRTSMPDAESDKRAWIAKYFGSDVKVRIGPYSADKWKHAKVGDILIDDRRDNIASWIDKGNGFGILHEYTDYPRTVQRFTALMTEFKNAHD